MKTFKYSFSIPIALIVTITSISVTSTPIKDYNTGINTKVIAEGVVTIFHGNGTREILNPSGYVIKDPVWIVPPPTRISIIYLRTNNNLLNNLVDKKVRVEGKYTRVPGTRSGEVNYTSGYDAINVDTIYCVK
jgi:hypothetical protein